MSEIHQIEQKLQEIGDAVFQELCDHILFLEETEWQLVSKLGSVLGRDKTRKGTPDTFFMNSRGHYVFVEHSTNLTDKDKKLAKDIGKCLDSSITGVKLEDLDKIILCFNFKLSTSEAESLKTQVPVGINLELRSIDWLSTIIATKHADLANKYLGIPMGSGQIVQIEEFKKRYGKANSKIGTPLDNPFIGREVEVSAVVTSIRANDFTVVTGPQGLGKTRICIEALIHFSEESPSCKVVCMHNQEMSILEDLSTLCNYNNKVVLFIDDANRLDCLKQIVSYTDTLEIGHLKLVMTVRDYAYEDILAAVGSRKINPIQINKLSSDAIVDIIKEEPYNIKNERYQQRISAIAKGSPRLAIMAAQYAQLRTIDSLYSIGELFEAYFKSFAEETSILKDKDKLRVAGVVAFFGNLQFLGNDSLNSVLEAFGVKTTDFYEVLEQLNNSEIVYLINGTARIPEQNLRDYIFYHAFLDKKVLSFKILLERFYANNQSAFEDLIISTNNLFGYQNVKAAIQNDILSYFSDIKSNLKDSLPLLEKVWIFIPEETIRYLAEIVDGVSQEDNTQYSVDCSNHVLYYNSDPILKILNKAYHYSGYIEQALAIGYQYSKRRPSVFGEWLKGIREHIEISYDDYLAKLDRQMKLVRFFSDALTEGYPLSLAFENIVPKLLGYRFTTTQSSGYAVTLYTLELKEDDCIRNLRTSVWQIVKELNRETVLSILETYAVVSIGAEPRIISNDLTDIIDLIGKSLQDCELRDCLIVHSIISFAKGLSIEREEFDSLGQRFSCKLYRFYEDIHWETPTRIITADEEKRIASIISIDSYESFVTTYESIGVIYHTLRDRERWGLAEVVTILVHNTFAANEEWGIKALKYIHLNNFTDYIPYRAFQEFIINKESHERFWFAIKTIPADTWRWELSFMQSAKEEYLSEIDQARFLELVKKWHKGYVFVPGHYKGLFFKYPDFVSKVVESAYVINSAADEQIIDIHLYPDSYEYLKPYPSLLRRIYIQKIRLSRDGLFIEELLFKIMESDLSFLLEYIKAMIDSSQKYYSGFDALSLGRVWNIDGIELELNDILKYLANNEYAIAHDSIFNSFFRDIDTSVQTKARDYLCSLVTRFSTDTRIVDMVVCIINQLFPDLLPKAISNYIEIKPTLDDFKSIDWTYHKSVYMNEEPIEDHLAMWIKVKTSFDIIKNTRKQLYLSYINERIAYCNGQLKIIKQMRYLES